VRLTTSDKKFLHPQNDIAQQKSRIEREREREEREGERKKRRRRKRGKREKRERQVSSNGDARDAFTKCLPFLLTPFYEQHSLRHALISLTISFLSFLPSLFFSYRK